MKMSEISELELLKIESARNYNFIFDTILKNQQDLKSLFGLINSMASRIVNLEDRLESINDFCIKIEISFAETLSELYRERPASEMEFVEQRLICLESFKKCITDKQKEAANEDAQRPYRVS